MQASVHTLRPVRKAYVFEEVLAQLEPLIRRGGARGGERLPPERELAKLLGVSRTSVREAIRFLTLRGRLDPRPGRGTLILRSPRGGPAGDLVELLARPAPGILDIMEFRRAIEPGIAAAAAARADAGDIARMDAILARAEEKVASGVPAVDEDAQFHHALAVATENVVFMRVVARSMDLVQAIRRRALQTPERNRRSLQAHRRILDAIRGRDASGAREAMLAHLDEVERLTARRSGEGMP